MKILVTGAAGFVGSHLSEALLDRGDHVVGLDAYIDYYPRPVKRRNLEQLLSRPTFTLVEADLRHDDLAPALEGCDAVVHAAAMPGLPMSWTDFELYSSCNLSATQRLADACREVPLRKFLYVSTSSVYGLLAQGDETMPTRPISPYGVTKLAAEHLLLAHRDTFGLPISIIRLFSVYGPRQRPDMAWHHFIDAISRGEPVRVHGDGQATRSCTFVSDAVAGAIGALDRGRLGEAYNIGGGEVLTVLETIGILGKLIDREPVVEHGAERAGDQRATAADVSKAHRELGYEPKVSPREGFARQVAWQTARQ